MNTPTLSSESVEGLCATATPISVRFADVDMMRVVHHSTYLHWFEQIRFHFLEQILGIDIGVLSQEGVACPLISSSINYIRAIKFNEHLTGFGRLEVLRNATFRFHYWIYRQGASPVLCATGTTSHCYVDLNLTLLLQAPKVFTEAFLSAKKVFPGCFVDKPVSVHVRSETPAKALPL